MVFYQGARRGILKSKIENIGCKLPSLCNFIYGTESEIIYFGYRGYSGNEGNPTEQGLCIDAEAMLTYAINYQR